MMLENLNSFDEFLELESQLCVPQDNLEDVQFFPSFKSESISLSELALDDDFATVFPDTFINFPTHDDEENDNVTFSHDKENSVTFSDNKDNMTEKVSFFKEVCKKPRSKKVQGNNKNNNKSFLKSWDLWQNRVLEDDGVSGLKQNKKKCSHCFTEKTPQWRMGPMGPKTLCNACGVRYKSGRLVPEYRPAASPSFDSMKHSNFHKKILQRKNMTMNSERFFQ